MTTPTLTDLAALAERVEAATGPSRELDAQIAIKLELAPDGFVLWDVPRFTASIDAALTLVPERMAYLKLERLMNGWHVNLKPNGSFLGEWIMSETCATPALALTAAALLARSAP